MSVRDDGGPAFPNEGGSGVLYPANGMSLRDWFAGRVLTAFGTDNSRTPIEDLAQHAYRIADAMLAERAK